jgi:hypothetical protein
MNLRGVTNLNILRHTLVKDENDALADFHKILNRRKNYFCQLLNICGVNDVRQTNAYI